MMVDSDETERVLKDHGGYEGIVSKMADDASRSRREREVERVFADPMPDLLERLDKEVSTRSEMLDRLNDRLDKAGVEQSVSRPTLYNWLDKYDLK